MKTKVVVERSWREWVNEVSMRDSMVLHERLSVMDDVAKEVHWYLFCPTSERDISNRISKYEMLKNSSTMDMDSFDKNWKYRIEFFHWIAS